MDLTVIRHFKGIADLIHSGRSLTKMIKSKGPNTLPCGTPESTLQRVDIESSNALIPLSNADVFYSEIGQYLADTVTFP